MPRGRKPGSHQQIKCGICLHPVVCPQIRGPILSPCPGWFLYRVFLICSVSKGHYHKLVRVVKHAERQEAGISPANQVRYLPPSRSLPTDSGANSIALPGLVPISCVLNMFREQGPLPQACAGCEACREAGSRDLTSKSSAVSASIP